MHAFFKGFCELADAKSRSAIWWSAGLSLGVFVASISVIEILLSQFPLTGIDILDTVIQTFVGVGGLVLAWFLFPVIATAIMGLFLDRVCRTIEQRDYPDDPPGTDLGMGSAVIESLRFLGFALTLNICVLILGLFLPIAYPLLYFAANGYLIAREYFFQAGLRHAPHTDTRSLFHNNRLIIVCIGGGLTLMLLVPVLNLCAPLVAMATMIHVFKSVHTRAQNAYTDMNI